MITFYDWLDEIEINEIAKYYFNQQTYNKWIPELLEKAIGIVFRWASKNPDTNWRRYALSHWQERKEELTQRLEIIAQEIFDNEPGIDYQNLLHRMVNAAQEIFQKEPFTRRHIAHADSQGKHPSDVAKRKPGRQSKALVWPKNSAEPPTMKNTIVPPQQEPTQPEPTLPTDYHKRLKDFMRTWQQQHGAIT